MITKKAINVKKYDYESLKKFVICFFTWFYPKDLPPPLESPSDFLARIEKISLSKAKQGLRITINEIVEIISAEWSLEQILEADKRFAAANIPTLSEMRLRYSKKYAKILKSGIINNEIEYYLIKGIIDGGFIDVGAPEFSRLQAMMVAHENNIIRTFAN